MGCKSCPKLLILDKPDAIKMFVTDFDGTLAVDNGEVSAENRMALQQLADKGVLRVIATGRSLFSLFRVVGRDFPVDYVVFSTGTGILDMKTGDVFTGNVLQYDDVAKLALWLQQEHFDFMVHQPGPDNHIFYAHQSLTGHHDFLRRLQHYTNTDIELLKELPQQASQFVVICNQHEQHIENIAAAFPQYKVIQTTSPFDNHSLWVEIFPTGVSKASGIEFLATRFNIERHQVVVVGNDYNDIDMLQWSPHAYVVADAPEALQQVYTSIAHSRNSAVAALVRQLMPECSEY